MQAAMHAHLAQVECAYDFLSLDTPRSKVKGRKKGPHGEVSLNWSLRFELANQANEQFSSTTANSRKITILPEHSRLFSHAKKYAALGFEETISVSQSGHAFIAALSG